jgi:hypothetical protein
MVERMLDSQKWLEGNLREICIFGKNTCGFSLKPMPQICRWAAFAATGVALVLVATTPPR